MHRTILEQLQEAKIPKTNMRQVEPEQIDVKVVGRFHWKELYEACAELPIGRGLMLEVPDNWNINAFGALVRGCLGMNRLTYLMRFSIRQAKDNKAIFVLRATDWEPVGDRLARQQKEQLEIAGRA